MKVIKEETAISFKRIPVKSSNINQAAAQPSLVYQQGEELAGLLILTEVGLGNQSVSGIISGDVNQ